MSSTKKTVQIKESALVNMIDKIVNEAIVEKKKEWIAEQAAGNKNTLLESKISDLENKLNQLLKGK